MKQKIAVLFVLSLLLSGCVSTQMEAVPATTQSAYAEAADPLSQLETDLAVLTEHPRPIGSQGEGEAVHYLKARLEAMGYAVTLQEYTAQNGITGNNVIAEQGSTVSGDILVISAHHDSFPTSFGANDNASGVAALLMVAEQLRNVTTDTQLRFISFTDEEGGLNGSRHYVNTLSPDERNRIVGCIHLDMLGGFGSDATMVCTTDGTANWLRELLTDQDSRLLPGLETASDHAVFQLAGIPAVLLTQDRLGYLYHSAGDTCDLLNLETIYDAAAAVVRTVEEIASEETDSYQELSREQASRYIYRQTRQSQIFYFATREENEAYLGFSGELVSKWEENYDFWSDTYELYQYPMCWFGGETQMTTQYLYRNGYLDEVKILPGENGYTTEQVHDLIADTYGTPIKSENSSRTWEWLDEIYSKFILLTEDSGKPVVTVYHYSVGISNTLASYDVINGEASIDDSQHAQIWDLLCKAIPLEHRQRIGQFQLFSDGFGSILAYTAPMGETHSSSNSHFVITVDYNDVYDEYGNPRDWSKLLHTLIHEFGHVLLENDAQIDLSLGADIHDPAGFIEGSFRQRYYEAFWQDPYQSYLGTYQDMPENYVSGYAGNVFHEDIADTFAVFVLGSKPAGDSVAQQKLLFFWNDEAMVVLRSEIRKNLGLP